MRFVPVPGAKALFSIWDTRVQDYQIFVEATAREWPAPNFTQGPKHPAVEVSWNDAHAFCQWLTTKEQKSGKISPDRAYRLPTAAEWSTAAGNTKYPWGDLFPPPKAAANLDQSLGVDEYRNTSPVGEFRPNPFGLHDMAGNVKQWCEDEPLLDPAHNSRVLRGSSWDTFRTLPLTTGFHSRNLQTARTGDTGFRCVLGPAPNPP
jgi:formylglycine-generating enzyme required for sulfatase activity